MPRAKKSATPIKKQKDKQKDKEEKEKILKKIIKEIRSCDGSSTCRFLDIAKRVINSQTNEIEIKTSSNFLTVLTPTGVKEKIFGDKLSGPIRNVIEPIGADTQCKKAGKPFEINQRCWLCGCPITTTDKKACEHIFPALRAIMFNGIITTNNISKRFDENGVNEDLLTRVTNMNYDWAHDNCNGSGAKGGMVLFMFDEGEQKFVVDKRKCNELQTKIKNLTNPKRDDCYKSKKYYNVSSTIYQNLEKVIQERLEPVNNEFNFFKNNVENQSDAIFYFAKYTEELIKLYACEEALSLLLTEEEIRAKEIQTEQEKRAREIEAEKLVKELLEQQIKFDESFEKYKKSQQHFMDLSQKGFLNHTYITEFVELAVKYQLKNNFSGTFFHKRVPDTFIADTTQSFIAFQQNYLQSNYPIGFIIEILDLFCYSSIHKTSIENGWRKGDWEKNLITILKIIKRKCFLYKINYDTLITHITDIYTSGWYTDDIAIKLHEYDVDTELKEEFGKLKDDGVIIPINNKEVEALEIDGEIVDKQEYMEISNDPPKGGSRYIYKSNETKANKKSSKKKRKTQRKRKSTIYSF